MKKILLLIVAALLALAALSACSKADTVSINLSKDADDFRVYRDVLLYNSITDKVILDEKGFCSLGNHDSSDRVSVTCKIGEDRYIKNTYLKSNNTLVVSNQLSPKGVSPYYHKVVLRPSEIVPDFEVR